MKQHIFAICAYKESPYLESCIKSLRKQTTQSEIILCTSTPCSFIKKIADKYAIQLFVRDGISDIQADWNFAYQSADSRFVTIAHQDDIYHKTYLEHLLKAAEMYNDMSVFTTDYVTVKNGKIQTAERVELVKKMLRIPLLLPKLNHLTIVKKSVLMFGNPICCPSCTYNKEILGEPLFTSEYKYALDWDTMLKLAKRRGRFICIEKPLMYYRIHDGATTKKCILDNRREREEAEMFRKFWPGPVTKLLLHFYKRAYDAYD